jgi:hypothetical protein
MTFPPNSWQARNIAFHRHNGTLALPLTGAAYDTALSKKGTDNMPFNMSPANGTPRGRTGRDQAPPPSPMSAPGAFTANLDQGESEGEEPIDCDLLMHFVEICLNKLDGDERDKFIGSLHSLLSSGVGDVLAPRGRNGNGSDQRSGNRTRATDRRPAQDAAIRAHVAALNHRSFLQRFPDAGKIRLSSSWRD